MHPFLGKLLRAAKIKGEAVWGSLFFSVDETLERMAARPFELHLEFTNVCNAKCVFCPYQFQEREHSFMSDEVFEKAVGDYVRINGGSVVLTPIVGEALIDPKFLSRVRYLRQFPSIDRIALTTNAILLDKFGIDAVLDSGLTTINISTSGFEEESYRRIYQSSAYKRMRDNVTALVEANARRTAPLNIWICLRTDRALSDVMKDKDFQPILQFNPNIDFTWSFTSAGGRITRELLPAGMKLRLSPPKVETCVSLYNGPIILPDGTAIACSCVAAVDALEDLAIGNVLEEDLLAIWTGSKMDALRQQFSPGNQLNPTCKGCDMYRNLELYRSSEGRTRAALNEERLTRPSCRKDQSATPFAGG